MKKIIASALAIILAAGVGTTAQARYYDAGQGRFVSPDRYIQSPYDPQMLNRYTYVRNNPIIYTDPTGNFLFLIPIIAGVIIGASLKGTHNHPFSQQAWQHFDTKAAVVGAVAGAAAGAAGGLAAGALGPLAGYGLGGDILIGAGAGAAAGGTDYAASTGLEMLTGTPGAQWNWGAFGRSVGYGAAAGAVIGGATSSHLMPFLRGSESFTGTPLGTPEMPSLTVTSPDVAGSGPAPPPSDFEPGDYHLRTPASVEGGGGKAPNFISTPDGQVFPVPNGASGPFPTDSPGIQYLGGSGGNGLDPRVTGMRIMEANSNQGARVVYMNKSGQTVNPFTGRTIPYSDSSAHFYFQDR